MSGKQSETRRDYVYKSEFKRIFDYLEKEIKQIELLKRQHKPAGRQIKRLPGLCALRYCLLLSYVCGTRIGEAVHVRRRHFLEKRTKSGILKYELKIENDIESGFKLKYGSSREIPINPQFYDLIFSYLEKCEFERDDYVISRKKKIKNSDEHEWIRYSKNRMFELLTELSEKVFTSEELEQLKVTFHSFRRGYASERLDGRYPLTALQHNLGHKNFGTTLGYQRDIRDREERLEAEDNLDIDFRDE